MNCLWIGTSVTAVATALTRCVLAKIHADSRRVPLDVTLKDTVPEERARILRAVRDLEKLE